MKVPILSELFTARTARRVEYRPVAGVMCAVLMPHAPVLVPGVGGERMRPANASCNAMREAAACVTRCQPDALVLISPHSPRKRGAFGVWATGELQGSFEQFGAPQASVRFANDPALADGIVAAARARRLATWPIQDCSLDHGALVPLWFLAEAGWAGRTVILGLNYPGEDGLVELGEAIATAAQALDRRIAIVASGDMSHRLTTDAPCGFHPQAHRFDEAFIQILREGDYRGIPQLDSALREHAAEDAADTTMIAAAAVGWNATGHGVLSYEGPFGVGYGVAILFAAVTNPDIAREAAFSNTIPHDGDGLPRLARESVAAALRDSEESPPPPVGEYLTTPRGVFVTVCERKGRLRGCAGTIEPVSANLVEETWRSARLAALHDGRFPPVTAKELANLRFSVSVLHSIEEISSPDKLDPGRYGVIISNEDGRSGLLLPHLPDIRAAEQQLDLVRRKARIAPDEMITMQRFEVDHFEERIA